MSLLQRFIHAGPPHEGGPACEEVHCCRCGKDGPRKWSAVCGECFHAWRWGWLLSLHDARTSWRVGRPLGPWDHSVPWWRRLRLRRPSRIWVCPCCSHNL